MGVMEGVQNFRKKILPGSDSVSSGMEECDRTIAELDEKTESMIKEIGQIYLSNNTVESAVGTPFYDSMRTIKDIAEKKEITYKKKLALQGLRICEKCGNLLPLDSVFCNKCGDKLEAMQIEDVQETLGVKYCPKCGAELNADSEFCVKCGTKL